MNIYDHIIYFLFYLVYYVFYIYYRVKYKALETAMRLLSWIPKKIGNETLHLEPFQQYHEQSITLNGITLYRISNVNTDYHRKQPIFFVHGSLGGYQSYRSFCLEMVRRMERSYPIEIWFPEYRTRNIQDSISDVLSMYRHLCHSMPAPFIIADSTGAFVAIQALQTIRFCPGIALLSPQFGIYHARHSINYPVMPPVYVWMSNKEPENEVIIQFVENLVQYGKGGNIYRYQNTIPLWMFYWYLHEEGDRAMDQLMEKIKVSLGTIYKRHKSFAESSHKSFAESSHKSFAESSHKSFAESSHKSFAESSHKSFAESSHKSMIQSGNK